MITREVDSKKSILGKVSFLKKRISTPEEINDEKISEDEFIETVLDHCKYSPVKNIRDPDNKKKIIFKKFETCKIKYINTKKINDMTLEKFTKLEKKDEDKNIKEPKKLEQNIKKDVAKKSQSIIKTKDSIRVAFRWQKFPYPIISNLKMNNKSSGILSFYIHETKDECFGTIAINSNNKGNWSLSCPDNKERSGVFKKKLGASGSVDVQDNIIIGVGYDNYRNDVKFIAK